MREEPGPERPAQRPLTASRDAGHRAGAQAAPLTARRPGAAPRGRRGTEPSPRLCWLCIGLAVSSLLMVTSALPPAAVAEPTLGRISNTFGMPGLIDMPTAEVQVDGTLGSGISRSGAASRVNLSFQIAPRLTGAFRYSRVPGVYFDGEPLYDRSFDIHFQIVEEAGLRPAIAIGLRDFMGTGVYAGEYLVATRSFGESVRVTAGLGWGRLGSSGGLGAPFGDRPPLQIGEGGNINEDQWFRGDAAPFAGISWQVNDKFALLAEYSSDAYERESRAGTVDRRSRFNFGAEYAFNDGVSVGAYYLNGEEIGLQLQFTIDPRRPVFPSGRESAPLPVMPRPSPAADPLGWSGGWASDPTVLPGVQAAVAQALANDGQRLESMALSATRAEVRVRNVTYGQQAQAIGRTARTLTRALPPSVETFVITNVVNGVPSTSVTMQRSDVERLENMRAGEMLARVSIADAAGAPAAPLRLTEDLYPRTSWALLPYVQLSFFDPDEPIRGDFGLELSGRYEIAPSLVLSGALRQKVLGNLGDSRRESIPTSRNVVRTDLKEYNQYSDLKIRDLTLAWYGRPGENLYSRLTAGYLETMYGGVSGEILWMPHDSRLAIGAEINHVKKRDYDQRFGFQDYTTTTGHISAYYDFGGGYMGQLDVGRYLAEDWGATVTFEREFANGWRVGAFASLTDMPAAEFGEGSFDRGLRITIPIAWISGEPTTAKNNFVIRSLVRDGGARVGVPDRLRESLRPSHTGEIYDGWGRFWR